MKELEPIEKDAVEDIFAALARMEVRGDEPDSIMIPEDTIPAFKTAVPLSERR